MPAFPSPCLLLDGRGNRRRPDTTSPPASPPLYRLVVTKLKVAIKSQQFQLRGQCGLFSWAGGFLEVAHDRAATYWTSTCMGSPASRPFSYSRTHLDTFLWTSLALTVGLNYVKKTTRLQASMYLTPSPRTLLLERQLSPAAQSYS